MPKKIIKYIFLPVFLTIFFFNTQLFPSEIHQKEQPSYCSMLHVSKADDIAIKPKPFLGIIMSPVAGEYSDDCVKFIKVTGIIGESPASKAGLKENDIILSINDKPV